LRNSLWGNLPSVERRLTHAAVPSHARCDGTTGFLPAVDVLSRRFRHRV